MAQSLRLLIDLLTLIINQLEATVYPIFGGLGDELRMAERRMLDILRSADAPIHEPQILLAGLDHPPTVWVDPR